jgi:hypothetical protein
MEQERVRKNVKPAEGEAFRVDLDAGVVRIRPRRREETP